MMGSKLPNQESNLAISRVFLRQNPWGRMFRREGFLDEVISLPVGTSGKMRPDTYIQWKANFL